MKKVISLFVIALCFFCSISAQIKQHIVYDLSGQDTADYSAVLQQCNDILKRSPDTEVEIVCHENAIYMLVKEKADFEARMNQLKRNGNINFVACANTMKRFNVDKTQLISIAGTVPVAVLEISQKKADGWNYRRTASDALKKWPAADRSEFISSCIDEAKKNISEEKAKTYCACMLSKMELKYPNPVDAAKLTDADIGSPEFQGMIKDCLK